MDLLQNLHQSIKNALDETIIDHGVIQDLLDELNRHYIHSMLSESELSSIITYIANNKQDAILDFLTELQFYVVSLGNITHEQLHQALISHVGLTQSHALNKDLTNYIAPSKNSESWDNSLIYMLFILRMCSNFVTRYYINKEK